jgi:hypothetical protein
MTVDLSWNRGDRVVHWNYAEQNVRKEFDLPIQCAVYIANPSSVVIVEGIQSSGPRNAVVFDLDGQERVRLRPPGLPALMGFDQVFQSRDVSWLWPSVAWRLWPLAPSLAPRSSRLRSCSNERKCIGCAARMRRHWWRARRLRPARWRRRSVS